ncbi:MAG: homoserine kinase [Verrucomicrobiales bacterium]
MFLTEVRVQVPGSTSNIGPGFDCLGIALAIYNLITITRSGSISPPHPMADESAAQFFSTAGMEPFPFGWSISGEVPISRGLGSSVTLRYGVLLGLNEMCGRPLNREELFRICAEQEGHPDNAGAAAFGGFFVCNPRGIWFRFEVEPELAFVLLIPSTEIQTAEARQVLPEVVSLKAAAANLANACAITAAFATRQYEELPGCFEDHFHQRQRAHLVPGLFEVIEAGTRAGALGGFLSGSGSTIACLVWRANVGSVAAAMTAAWGKDPVKLLVVEADNAGAHVV